MANSIYPMWKQALMSEIPQDKSLDQGDLFPEKGVYVALVSTDGGYVYSDAHQFFTEVTNIVGTPSMITTPTVAGRVFSGDTVVFTNVTGPVINAIMLYRSNAGANTTWRGHRDYWAAVHQQWRKRHRELERSRNLRTMRIFAL